MSDCFNLIKEIRQNLSSSLPGLPAQLKMAPSIRAELIKVDKGVKPRNSAVLILLFPDLDDIHTLLIKRTEYNGPHSGQISLPGGKYEEMDINLIQTALREAEEEIGVKSKDVEILGTLTPLYIPVSNMDVLPVVGLINYKPDLHLNSQEVEFVVTTPIRDLKNPINYFSKTLNVETYSFQAPYIKISDQEIWGATAMILSEFIELFN